MTVGAAIQSARADGRAALIGYLPAGFPDLAGSIALITAMIEGGIWADIVEVGLPYSDPVMDGPTIQIAAEQALAGGTRVADVLQVVSEVSVLAPTLVMTYWNPVERIGVETFAERLAAAGGAGLITPDLIPDEAADWIAAADAHDLDKVFLVAPSSTTARLALTASHCRGFVYAAAVMGVTGARERSSSAAPLLVQRIREVTTLPIGVGLGVSNGAQAAQVASYADAVIVGSAFVRAILDAPDAASSASAVKALATDLARGVRREL